MKTLLVDIRTLSNKPSGIGNYTYGYLKSILKNEDLIVYGIVDIESGSKIEQLKMKGLKIVEYGYEVSNSFKVFSYNNFINRLISELNPDVFWQPNFLVTKNLNLKNTRFLVTIHDLSPIECKEHYSWWYSMYFSFYLRNTIKQADQILCISKATINSVVEKFYDIIKTDVMLAPPIIDLDQASNDNSDEEYFLYIGNLESRKGIILLLHAYLEYYRNGGEKSLILAGHMKNRNLSSLIDDINRKCNNHVLYKGYVDNKVKIELLKSCSAFIYPSYYEGYGIPPMEALKYGKSIILSDIDVFKDVYGDIAHFFHLDLQNKSTSIMNLVKTMESYTKKEEKMYEDFISNCRNDETYRNVIDYITNS